LCSNSDEQNLCREDCNGVPPSEKVDAKTKPKANPPTSAANVFVTEKEGVDLTGVDDSDEDKLLQKANQILSQKNSKSSVTSRALEMGYKKTRGNTDETSNCDDDSKPMTRSKDTRSNDSKDSKDKRKDWSKGRGNEKRKDQSKDKSKDQRKDQSKVLDQRKDQSEDQINDESNDRSKGKTAQHDSDDDAGHDSTNQEQTAVDSQTTPPPGNKSPERAGPITPTRTTTSGKTPQKAPRKIVGRNYIPSRLPGGRPTVDPRIPNHRAMILPLLANEPVVFHDPTTNKARSGVVVEEVNSSRDPVTVLSSDDEIVEGLTIDDFVVVKVTDYLIYVGARYCVFGPIEKSFCNLTWGSAWLDLVGEQAHFHDNFNGHDKILFELKRLDAIMLRYPGVPDCPVLVLGFLPKSQEESDWRAIGVMDFHREDVLLKEGSAVANICYIAMTELKKEFATSETYLIEEVVEMWMTDHPTLKMYEQAMKHIHRWTKHNPRWFPTKTWKGALTALYPKQFKALFARGLEAKPCNSCQSLEKQLGKANVSLRLLWDPTTWPN
jgi:hypothetical protein